MRKITVHQKVGDTWTPFPDHRMVGGVVWHYTDAAAALGIIRDGEIWASSVLMMNDSGELDYAIARISAVFEAWEARGNSGAHSALEVSVRSLEKSLKADPPFVISASKSERLLNQWSSYSAADGYAIGFRADSLLLPATAPGAPAVDLRSSIHGWREVIYEVADQEDHIRSVFDELVKPDGMLVRGIAEGGGRVKAIAAENLLLLATTLKDPAFAAESEVRYTFRLPKNMHPEFRATLRGIVPFVRLNGTEKFGDAIVGASSLPVQGVTVGPPTATASRRMASLDALRRVSGHAFSIKSAEIPYLP